MAGCMPVWVHNYYSPNADGGTVTKSTCRKSIGPPNRSEILKEGVIIGVQAHDGVLIDVDIEVPSGKTVKLTNPMVTIKSTNGNATGAFEPLIPYGGAQWQMGGNMVGETKIRKLFFGGKRTDFNTYLIRAKIPFPKSDVIKVTLPIVTINNQNYMLPEITFTKDTFIEFFMPINC